MSDSKVAERLKTFIESKGLSYSQFADSCGIPRPSLSQLLTGRNKKVNDVLIGQIHKTFPELSIIWLLFGEGNMDSASRTDGDEEKNEVSDFGSDAFSYPGSDSQESNKILFSSRSSAVNEISKENALKSPQSAYQLNDVQIDIMKNKIKELQGQIEKMRKNPRKAVQITVYYEDNTFETFFPR